MKYLCWISGIVVLVVISFAIYFQKNIQYKPLNKSTVKKEMFNDIEKWNNKCINIGGDPLFYIDEITYVKVCISDEKIKVHTLCSNENGQFSKTVNIKENTTEYICRKEMYLKKLEDVNNSNEKKIKI